MSATTTRIDPKVMRFILDEEASADYRVLVGLEDLPEPPKMLWFRKAQTAPNADRLIALLDELICRHTEMKLFVGADDAYHAAMRQLSHTDKGDCDVNFLEKINSLDPLSARARDEIYTPALEKLHVLDSDAIAYSVRFSVEENGSVEMRFS